MIRELLTYLFERPLLSEARTFGHLSESISLLSRESRCQKSWLPHRTQCKNFIKDHLKLASHFDSVLVLGSGPLHEIPIEELSKAFKKVTLVDIVHLKNTKDSVAHLKNLEFVEHDITELEHSLHFDKMLIDHVPQKFLDQDWGLVLSVNLMSQLPIHLEKYIQKKLKNKFTDLEISGYLQNSTRNHLKYLNLFNTTVLMITDTEVIYCDKNDNVIQIDKNYDHLSLPEKILSWNWNLAPIPEFQKDVAIKMKVGAFAIKKQK